jgi:hypothetical protein
MGEHTATPTDSSWLRALKWCVAHRRKLIAGAIVALPLVSRFVPGFPADVFVDVLRSFLGT